jgi:hypothetical protein
VIGYGDTRPIQPNDSEQGRNANRRVVVVILSTELQRQKAPGDQNGLGPISPSTAAAPATTTPDNATAPQTASAIPVNNPSAANPAESGTPATAFPAPPAQATLAAPGESAQLPARPSVVAPAATAASPNVTLATPGARLTGSGIKPAP